MAAAALMALPFGAPAVAAPAPAAPAAAKAVSGSHVGSPLIQVQRQGRGGGPGARGGFRGGGPGMGGRGFRGGGPGMRGPGFRRGGPGFSRGAGRRHWAGTRPGFRRGYHRHHRHWRGGIGFGAPYFYGAWGPSYYYDDFYDAPIYDYDEPIASYDDDAVERCAARYRSFDRRTGTFLHNNGQRRLCPYLR